MIPLSIPFLSGNELRYVSECIETGWVSTAGGFVARFEEAVAAYSGARRAVAVSSGTAALHSALVLLGIKAGDEVLVPTVTFIATPNAVKYVGAEPVFTDCDDRLNMDPAKVRRFCEEECSFDGKSLVNRRSGNNVRAVMPVHIFGHPVDMEPLMETAERYNLFVIEDATESLGSKYTSGRYSGRMTGTIGHVGCYSFNGNKIMTTGGGGMLVTDDEELSSRAKYLTTQAKDDEVYSVHEEIGYNYRMTNVEAAVGVAQLERLDEFIGIKRANFELYRTILGKEGLSLLVEPSYGFSNYWFYSLVTEKPSRDELLRTLAREGIQARPLWRLNHLQKPYLYNQSYSIERAPYWYERVINLPCSVGITEEEIREVCGVIREQGKS